MQFYLFKEACATKETGPDYPQIQKWKSGYDDDKADSYYSYYEASSKGSVFPDFTPDLDALVMYNRAKPTDIISSGLSIGLIISKKLKAIIEQFKFQSYRLYPTKIIHKKVELNEYYFMHIISDYYSDYLDFVNYKQSVFITAGIANDNPQNIILTSKQDYLNKAKELQNDFSVKKNTYRAIYAERICFNREFDKNLDFFIAPFGIDYYISQNLKNALVENGITGYEIQTTNRILA
jgi:hypothetical protein